MLLSLRVVLRAVTRFQLFFCRALMLGAISAAYAQPPTTLTVNDFGDAGDGTCSSACTLRDAIANIAISGTIDFAPGLLTGTITLTKGQIPIAKPLLIQGPGAARLAVSAAGASRLFEVSLPPASTIRIAGLTLRDGAFVGADGADGAPGASPSEDGKNGILGGVAQGGCIDVFAGNLANGSLVLDGVDLNNCYVQGGHGGNGGAGAASSGGLTAGGAGGKGSDGGYAAGACIRFLGFDGDGDLILRNSSVTHCQALAGNGGAGGDGGTAPVFHGVGGAGGAGGDAAGVAISFQGNTLSIRNSTIADADGVAGDGAAGGTGDSTYSLYPGGAGGDGGLAAGGLVYAIGSGRLEFATLANGDVHAGSAGSGGSGAAHGADGTPGQTGGAAFVGYYTGIAEYLALSTAIVGSSSTPLCAGLAGAVGSINLAESASCPSNLQGTLAQVFRPFDSSQPLPAYVPVYHSEATDAVPSCNDLTLEPVTADEHGTPRPQGGLCDIGAIEADYLFVDGFD